MPPPDPPEPSGPEHDGPALAAAVLAAASGSQLEATLHGIVTAAVERVDATYGAMGVLAPDGARLDRFVIVGMDAEDERRIGRLPSGRGILGLLVDEPTELRLDDLSLHPASTGFPPGHPPMRSFLGVPVRVRDAVFGNLYLTEKRSGDGFTPADVEVAKALAGVAGLAIENARLAEGAEKRERWSQATTELATTLLSGTDTDQVLRSVCSRVAALTGADAVGLAVPSGGDDGDDEKTVRIVAAAGAAADDVEGVRIPVAGTALGATLRDGIPRVVDDIRTMPVGRRPEVTVELSEGLGPALIVPLGPPSARGLLVSLRAARREGFDTEDLELLSAFATQASLVLELARAQEREHTLRMQADRDRIARDLHDHVVQRIFATALSLDRLSRSLEGRDPDSAAQLARSVDELDATSAEIRAAIFELQEPDDAPPTALRRRLRDLVRQITEGHPVRRDIRTRGAIDQLRGDLVPDLVAVVRELVTNVVRHASASRVTVNIAVDGEVRVVVADDGIGLTPGGVTSGLANLAARAERRGGRLSISGGPAGTQVCWTVPRPSKA